MDGWINHGMDPNFKTCVYIRLSTPEAHERVPDNLIVRKRGMSSGVEEGWYTSRLEMKEPWYGPYKTKEEAAAIALLLK